MPERLPRPLLRGVRGALSCGHPLAAAAGGQMLAEGGSAVDSAVAAGLALCVLLPDACGLGGDALALVRTSDGAELGFTGSGDAPAELGTPIPADGGGSATVPGAVAALADVHRYGGRLDWDRVVQPAIQLADRGMPLSEDLHGVLALHRDRLGRRCDGWALLDARLTPGGLIRQPALAAALRAIARDGPDAFYCGPLAEAIARDAHNDGGWLSYEDLVHHRTSIAAPITRTRLGMRLSAQPPVSQAMLLLTALGGLQASGRLSGHARVHALVEALDEAFLHRDDIAGGPDGGEIADRSAAISDRHVNRARTPNMGAHTTAVAAADADGNVVSMLLSVFDDFGSALLIAEGGFLLNDRAHGFTQGANAPAPGRRPVHTLSPAMASDADRVFALCTPGADGQVQTLAQILTYIALDGVGINHALDVPRFRSGDGRLAFEADADPSLLEDLRDRGHEVLPMAPGPLFGVAACAGLDLRAGTVFTASDPRRESWSTVL